MPWTDFRNDSDDLEDKLVPMSLSDHAAAQLGDPDWLFANTLLAGRSRPYPRHVPCRDFFQLCRNMRDHSAEPGFHFGRTADARRPVRGGLALALLTAPDLLSGMDLYARVQERAAPFATFGIRREGNLIVADIAPLLDNDVMALIVENGLYSYHQYAIQHLGQLPDGTTVRLRHKALAPLATYRNFFRCPVMFESSENAFSLPADAIRAPEDHQPDGLWLLANAQCEVELAALDLSTSARKVMEFIRVATGPGHRPPGVFEAASAMGLSARSLNRRLAEAGTSYQALADKVQMERAIGLIADSQYNIGEVADQLGFADQSSFGRSFRRWFGTGPLAYRSSLGI